MSAAQNFELETALTMSLYKVRTSLKDIIYLILYLL